MAAYERDETGHWLAGVSQPTLSMRALMQAQDALVTHQARRMGLNTTDMKAMRLLDLHGPLGPTELARRLDLRPASITTLIDRLETAGHLERVRDSDDRRRVTVRARPEALALVFDTWAPTVSALDQVGHDLTTDDQQVVCAFLDRATAVIQAVLADSEPDPDPDGP